MITLEPKQTAAWALFPHLVVRQAGFPADWLKQLKAPRAGELAAATSTVLRRQQELTTRLLQEDFPAAVRCEQQTGSRQGLRLLSRLRARLGKALLTPADLAGADILVTQALVFDLRHWLGLRQECASRHAEGTAVLTQEFAEVRKALHHLISDEYTQEALYLSNPDFYQTSVRDFLSRPPQASRTAKARSLERRLLSYVQRLCAKNDTASFFGPMNTAVASPNATEPVDLVRTPGRWRRRAVFFAYWATAALSRIISAEPGIHSDLVPRLHPLASLGNATLSLHAIGKEMHLNPAQVALLRAVSGARTVRQVAQHLGRPEAEVAADIERLVRSRLLICHIEVPSTIFHPFSWLIEQVRALPDTWDRKSYWLDTLERLDQMRQEFIGANLEGRIQLQQDIEAAFTSATGLPSRRSMGEMYADRTLLYEECEGNMERFQLGPAFVEELQARLSPALDLCAAYGTLLRQYYQLIGKAIFSRLSPDGNPVPYLAFVRELQATAPTEFASRAEPLDRFRAALQELVASRRVGHVSRLSREDLVPLLREIPLPRSCHTSPDIMLAAPDLAAVAANEYQLILGEMHQFIYTWGSQLYFYDRWPEANAALNEWLSANPPYDHIALVLNERKHKGLVHESFPGLMAEVWARSSAEQSRVARAADLQVAMEHGDLVLQTLDSRSWRIYTGGDEQLHLWIFALPRVGAVPISLGAHSPRIEVGEVVYQRERWELSSADLLPDPRTDLFTAMVSLQAAREQFGFPTHVFVRVPSEKKPFFIDLVNPLSVELLQALLQQNDQVTVVEMLPDLDNLWLKDEAGSYCCELRTLALRTGEGD